MGISLCTTEKGRGPVRRSLLRLFLRFPCRGLLEHVLEATTVSQLEVERLRSACGPRGVEFGRVLVHQVRVLGSARTPKVLHLQNTANNAFRRGWRHSFTRFGYSEGKIRSRGDIFARLYFGFWVLTPSAHPS